jgi:hypothetical protein
LFEMLARRAATAKRASAWLLLALTALFTPGVVRVDPPSLAEPSQPGARPPAPAELALFELPCDPGVWKRACLERVDALTRALSSERRLVAEVDSITARRRLVSRDGALASEPIVAELPESRLELRRLHARIAREPLALRGLVAPGERAALVSARLRPGVSPREVAGLVERVRAQFALDGLAAFAPSEALRARELGASRERVTLLAAALAVLALVVALAGAGWRDGALAAGLGALALGWSTGLLGLLGVRAEGTELSALLLGPVTCAGVTALVLPRLRAELRRGLAPGDALGAALALVSGPVAALGLAAGLAVGVSLLAEGAARSAAMIAGGMSLACAALASALGLPLALSPLAASAGGARGALAVGVDGLLERGVAWLDFGARARRGRATLAVSVLLVAFAALGLGSLRADTDASHSLPAGSPARLAQARLARDLGGASWLWVALDSGAPGGALEPLFLERALALEETAAALPEVAQTKSLLDTAVLPATRAVHGGDPDFAVVPPTRADVERALALGTRFAAPLDAERRYLAIELLADLRSPGAPARIEEPLRARARALFGGVDVFVAGSDAFARSAADGALSHKLPLDLALAWLLALLASAWVARSIWAGGLVALPAGLSLAVVLGLGARAGLRLDPGLSACALLFPALGALSPLALLRRTGEQRLAGSEPALAISLALRELRRPIASGALAGLAFLALLASDFDSLRSAAALGPALLATSAATTLVVLPAGLRALGSRLQAVTRGVVLETQSSAPRRQDSRGW